MHVRVRHRQSRAEGLPADRGIWLSAQRGYHGIVTRFLTIDDRGSVNLEGTCSVAGLGGDPYRDGSYEYYISEPIVTNDYKGVGAFILAAVEIEAALRSQPAR